VTGDPDINPEGFKRKILLGFATARCQNFTVQFMAVAFNEATAGTDS